MVASAKTDLSTRFQAWLGGSEAEHPGGNRPGGGVPRSGTPLPCLNSNNCTSHEGKSYGTGRKTAFALERNVEAFLEKTGIERAGFLTLTFAEHIVDRKEAQKRWHSLRTHVLKRRYLRILRVFERQKSGRIHFHVLVALAGDIRSGFLFDDAARGVYRSANAALRAEWAFWRKTAPRFGFGRTELLPIKNAAAMGKYVGKYIGKHLDVRLPEDKGVRLVQCSAGWKAASSCFAFNSPGGWCYRSKLRQFAIKRGCISMRQLREMFGRSWAHQFREVIAAEVLRFYPTFAHARADGRDCTNIPDDAVNLYFA
jgi:hypothetical protein